MKLLTLSMLILQIAGLTFGATRYDVFVDVSASVTAPQRQYWLQTADKLTERFQPGDAVTLYPLHNNTGSAGAVMDLGSRPMDETLGAYEQIGIQTEFMRMKKGFRTALHDVLTEPGRATETDIFSAFDRIHRDPQGRQIVVLIISDMMQSTAQDGDMEKTRITERSAPALIQAAARRHRWGSATLAGVSVRCLLPPQGAEARAVATDRLSARFFWDMFCRSLGGKLDNFDTQL